MDYQTQLENLKKAQQQATQIELANKRDQSLSNLNAEEASITPTYQNKRDVLNTQNRISAKNYNESLINRGMNTAGIAPQAELSFNNQLQKGLSSLNQDEAGLISDVARRRTDIGNDYANGLSAANQKIESDYIDRLLTEQQKAWEREMAQKQYELSKYSTYNSGSSSSNSSKTFGWMPGTVFTEMDSNGNVTYTNPDGAKVTVKAGVNPYTGTSNSDVKNGVFSNGYQPNNIGGQKLSSIGSLNVNGNNQSIWSPDGGKTQYYWDGTQNKYIKYK